ncbi:Coiled-coil domain-containing protein 111-like protein [Auxenochlorella protothecoides]|uniref:DNA-directed primase/polymerase protein n=1 Tax=Auxenochlorella protothecoides TaxID=3075 RepID=A0A087SG15_AUXPR|nr:Coiled-coil domain-containing protein 111-like protein [Auxenochlorella protothecoides]KFM24669.1 Coiled-coil domain-containing protein 111-like protein [Auxenochlorella protothecoides]
MPVRAALASLKENVPRKSPVPRVPAAAWGPDAAGSHQRFREALRTLKTAAEGAASQACEAGQSQSSGESPPAKADARPGADGEPEPEAVAPVPLRQPAVHVFCVERSGRGGAFYRSFAAASYPAVWQQYHQTPALQRHWYEVIREGHPCHLYFDLEFPIELNPGVDGQALTQRLLVLVQKCLWNKFQLRMDARQHVVLLDSTSATKFSSHLVVKLPGHAFQDNAAAGRFVRSVLLASGTELTVVQGLDARTGQPVRSPFVDTAVNRHFRMAGSCKGGKTAVLQTLHGQGVPPETAFMQALVGHVQLKVLAKEAIPFMERMATARAGQLTTRVRTLAFCGQQGHVAYGLAGPGCHYCENIGRCHTSNHAFYVVNFVSGHFAQKCYDPDCSGYRSAWMPLPPGLCCSNGGEPRGARVSEA